VKDPSRWAVPNGGDGGNGGDVWLVADHNVSSLLAFRTTRTGGPRTECTARARTCTAAAARTRGHGAEGTVVQDMYTGDVLADLVNHGDRWLAAEGGRGGRGNAKFLSNRRRAPSFAEQGEVGEERWLRLELKLMADVAWSGSRTPASPRSSA
jgi:GTPase